MTGRFVVTENVTANGVVEFLDRWFDPGDTSGIDDLLRVQQRHMEREQALILGRQTFEDFRSYWPHQTDDVSGSTAHLNRVPKYVVSGTMADPAWENSKVLRGDLAGEVADLKARLEGELGTTGSISVVHALLQADLVDEVRLFVYPVVTGRGRGIVPPGMSLSRLRLMESQAFRGGVVMLQYEVLKRDSFGRD